MDPNLKLLHDQGELLEDQERYIKLVRKLNYLIMTRPDIAYLISVVYQLESLGCCSYSIMISEEYSRKRTSVFRFRS